MPPPQLAVEHARRVAATTIALYVLLVLGLDASELHFASAPDIPPRLPLVPAAVAKIRQVVQDTAMRMVVLPLTPEFDAVTVYDVGGCMVVGVPLMVQVVPARDRPAGSEGLAAHDVAGGPFRVGVTAVIAVFTGNVYKLVA